MRNYVRTYRRADVQTFILAINCIDVYRDNYIGNYIDV